MAHERQFVCRSIDGPTVSLRPLFGANQNHVYMLDVPEFLKLLHKWQGADCLARVIYWPWGH